MSVSVSMPQLGESVTEGTVTRWLKREGERVEADEPLLEISTDKVDTEIPSPVSGILRGITVAEDETVAVGAELAVIDEEGSADGASAAPAGAAADSAAADSAAPESAPPAPAPAVQGSDGQAPASPSADGGQGYQGAAEQPAGYQQPPAYQAPYQPTATYQQPTAQQQPPAQQQPTAQQQPPTAQQPAYPQPGAYQQPAAQPAYQQPPPEQPAYQQPAYGEPADQQRADQQQPADPQQPDGGSSGGEPAADSAVPGLQDGADSPYVTPLVRKLAAEHEVDLDTVAGTGVGGRIRKQDVLDAARVARSTGTQQPEQTQARPAQTAAAQAPPVQAPAAQAPPVQAPPAQAPPVQAPAAQAPPVQAPAAQAPAAVAQHAAGHADADQASGRPAIVPSSLRGTTERMSRARQVIAQRMVESLQTSAQLTTVVEADVTAIARLRERAKAAFEAREGVKLSFLPFFALAVVEALKVHPRLNAVIDTASAQVTYHDAEHLGIAVDTDRGLMVPVIRGAGDLNIAGLARKIADLAQRTRAGHVSPDDLSGGTFTLTNTGSRGALFDTPIINQPQVGILGTGTVVKRAVVVDDPALGEVITVRSMVYLALTYDHRLVDGADAARFLVTMKSRLEEGAFETELGL